MDLKQITTKDQISSVLTVCRNDFYNQKYNNESFINLLTDKFFNNGIVLVAYIEDEIAGFISFYANDFSSKRSFLSMIIIRNEFQRKGVGTVLLNGMETFCIENGFKEIFSEIDDKNIKSQSFFYKNGFVLTDQKGEGTSFYLKKL